MITFLKEDNGKFIYTTDKMVHSRLEIEQLLKKYGATKYQGYHQLNAKLSEFNPATFNYVYGKWDWEYLFSDVKLHEEVKPKVVPKTKRSHIRPFESLTKKGQAVRIAKDVLAQLNAGKYIAQSGRWVGNLSIYKPIQAELANTSCTACAIGSIVLSACNLDPNKKGLSWNSALAPETGQLGFATKYFDNPGEIEAFFESNQGASRVAQTLGTLEWNDETRLRVIMNNIIKNRGVFNLTEALTDIEKEPKL